jgi:predicted dehydrogenase
MQSRSNLQQRPARVALVGLHGHGGWHLRNLAGSRVAELVAVCDLRPPGESLTELVGDVPWTDDLDQLLAHQPDITILCTPIHTHVDLAGRVARAGSHLLLEKPTAPSLTELDRLVDEVAASGASCQVGFQALGSGALGAIVEVIERGEIGELVGIGGAGIAVRDASYYGRADWAGRRRLGGADGAGGVDVVDGVLTNPYVHAISAALRIAGAEEPGRVVATELELHRANDIEADDTSVARLVLTGGATIVVAATTCGPGPTTQEPYLVVHGTSGRIVWPFKHHQVLIETTAPGRVGRRTETHGHVDLLENLVAHLAEGEPLIVPVESTRAVTGFVDAVRRAPEPVPIGPEHLTMVGDGDGRRPVVADVAPLVRRAADELATFSELDCPWAAAAGGDEGRALSVTGGTAGRVVVARYETAPDLPAELAPRPYLHPVRTMAGTVVSDTQPEDHRWHLGVGTAIQDIGGTNAWGGRTFVRDLGYLWLSDHGTVRHTEWIMQRPDALVHQLGWFDRHHRCLLTERRTIAAVTGEGGWWALRFRSELRNITSRSLELGSPGSNGRPGGGYGGFFWRLPRPLEEVQVWTESAEGEAGVHGTTAPWLAWSAQRAEGAFTLLAAPGDDRTAADPWFVRVGGYPGFGSALAWNAPVSVAPDRQETRELLVLVADGRLEDGARLCAELHAAAGRRTTDQQAMSRPPAGGDGT